MHLSFADARDGCCERLVLALEVELRVLHRLGLLRLGGALPDPYEDLFRVRGACGVSARGRGR